MHNKCDFSCVEQLYKHHMSVWLCGWPSVRTSVWPSHFSRRYLIEFSFKFSEIFRKKKSGNFHSSCGKKRVFSFWPHIRQISTLWRPNNGRSWWFLTIIWNTNHSNQFTSYALHKLDEWFDLWPRLPNFGPLADEKWPQDWWFLTIIWNTDHSIWYLVYALLIR